MKMTGAVVVILVGFLLTLSPFAIREQFKANGGKNGRSSLFLRIFSLQLENDAYICGNLLHKNVTY
jgi:hypothetical protein